VKPEAVARLQAWSGREAGMLVIGVALGVTLLAVFSLGILYVFGLFHESEADFL
jgi:hypothetical protein